MMQSRAGFSLTELIVVIAIVMLLLSLALPAIQRARGAARRLSCSNQLRQIALGVELHKVARHHMPSGTESETSQTPYTGLLLRLTPYVEQEVVSKKSSREFERTTNPFRHETLRVVIPLFLCPEDGRVHGELTCIRQNTVVAATSYLGVNGTSAETRNGVLFVQSKTRDADVLDGLSNTLLLGERPPSRYFDLGWWYAGVGGDGQGTLDHTLGVSETTRTPYKLCGDPTERFRPMLDDECSARVFWSLHESGTHFAFCDSSVHYLSSTIDRTLLNGLATRAGAEIGTWHE